MSEWTRRGAMGAGAALIGAAALADAVPLAGVLSDGPDGVLSAGVIARRGDGARALAVSAGRRISGAGEVLPFGLDDPFRVASVSKMITTVGLMRLVEAGCLDIDEDASDLLGFRLRHPAFPDRPIRLKHLLSHTSGLRNGPSYPVPAGHVLAEAFTPAGQHWDGGAWFGSPDHAPGDWFAYADVNFCLVAQIIERVTAVRFDRYMTRRVLAPLALDSGYNWSGVSQAKRDRAAPAYRWLSGAWTVQTDGVVPPAPAVAYPQPKGEPPVAEADLKLGENGFLFSPLGGLRVSLSDMDRLAAMFRVGGAPIVTRATLERIETAQWRFDSAHPNGETGEASTGDGVFGAYGLGVEIPGNRPGPGGDAFFGPGSADWRGHLGDAYGWMTGLFWNRSTGETLVYALNGMREEGRQPGRRSALTPPEEALIDAGLSALRA